MSQRVDELIQTVDTVKDWIYVSTFRRFLLVRFFEETHCVQLATDGSVTGI